MGSGTSAKQQNLDSEENNEPLKLQPKTPKKKGPAKKVQLSEDVQQPDKKQNIFQEKSSKYISPKKQGAKSKGKDVVSKKDRIKSKKQNESQKEKENIIKIQKAKQIKNQQNDTSFINSIVTGNSKNNLKKNYPDLVNQVGDFKKPFVQYSPQKKGSILPNAAQSVPPKNRWNRSITQMNVDEQGNYKFQGNDSYVAIGEPESNAFRKKEIEKKLNELRNFKGKESRSRAESGANGMEIEDVESLNNDSD